MRAHLSVLVLVLGLSLYPVFFEVEGRLRSHNPNEEENAFYDENGFGVRADGGEVNVVDSNVGENTDGGDKAGGDVVSVGEGGGVNGTDIGGDNITAQAGGGGGGGGAGAGGKAGASGGGGALGGQGGPAANTRPPIVTVCPPVCDEWLFEVLDECPLVSEYKDDFNCTSVFVLNDENPCNYFLCSLDVHPTDCTDGRAKKTEFTCDEGTYFSEDLMYCDFICNAEEEIECPTTPRPYPCENYTSEESPCKTPDWPDCQLFNVCKDKDEDE